MDQQFFTDNESAIVTSNRVLYTPSVFARTSLLHLQEIGELTAKKAHTSSREGLQSYLFFMVVDGAGELKYNDKNHKLIPGSCVFIDCRKHYSHTTDENNLWILKWCHFYGPTMSSVYDKYIERGGRPSFSPANINAVDSVLTTLMSTAISSDYMRDMLINENLSTLIRLIMSESWHPEDATRASKRKSVLDVKAYIDEHYNEKMTLDGLSKKFFISKYYLTHSFKDQFGITLSSYISNVRITHAKQMLRFTNKNIEEIGLETGVGAASYFSRVFKEIEGVSPSVYREQW